MNVNEILNQFNHHKRTTMSKNPLDRMHEIAVQMADHFQRNIKTKELVCWNIYVCKLIADYKKEAGSDYGDEALDWLCYMTYDLIPLLMEAKTESEEREILIENLPTYLNDRHYDKLKKVISDISFVIIDEYARLSCGQETISKHMRIISTFMWLSEVQAVWNIYYDRHCKEIAEAA